MDIHTAVAIIEGDQDPENLEEYIVEVETLIEKLSDEHDRLCSTIKEERRDNK